MSRFSWLACLFVALVPILAGCDDHNAPAAPRGLYSITGDQKVDLYWLANTEADLDHYNVYVSTAGAAGPFTYLATTRDTHYADTGVRNGATYWYGVTAVSRYGKESEPTADNIHDTPRPEYFGWRMWNSYDEDSLGGKYDTANAIYMANADSVSRRNGHADVYFEAWAGHHWLVTGTGNTGLQDGGPTPGGLEQYDYAPQAPGNGWVLGQYAELVPGHTYLVWTDDNHYAKIYVRSVADDFAVVDWAYQVDRGNRELKARVPVAHLHGLAPVER